MLADDHVATLLAAETRAVSIRRLCSQNQTPMSLDAAIASLVDEATPPDLKRRRAAEAAATPKQGQLSQNPNERLDL